MLNILKYKAFKLALNAGISEFRRAADGCKLPNARVMGNLIDKASHFKRIHKKYDHHINNCVGLYFSQTIAHDTSSRKVKTMRGLFRYSRRFKLFIRTPCDKWLNNHLQEIQMLRVRASDAVTERIVTRCHHAKPFPTASLWQFQKRIPFMLIKEFAAKAIFACKQRCQMTAKSNMFK